MYNDKDAQFILKQSSGMVWNFFYDDVHGICCSTMTKRRTWTEPISLQKNACPYFYMDLDYDDRFHLLFQDRNGNILYSRIENENIKTIPVLKSKSKSVYNKHFYLIPSKKNIQLFYVIEHNDRLILAHQQIIGEEPSNPRVIDYVNPCAFPYVITTDRNGTIYAYYQASDGKYLQLGYKKYMGNRNYWGEFTPVTRFNGDCEFPHVICDINNVMHLCYQRRAEKQFELVYQQKIPDRNLWSGETVISSSAYSFSNSDMVFANGNLYIYWVRENAVYFSSSSDSGTTWSKPARLNFSSGRQLFCFNYRTNYPYESDKIIARCTPGNFINGFTMAFYEDSSSNIYNLSAEELRSMIVDTLKLLKTNIEEIRENISEMQASITELRAAQQHLEREVTKYSIKMTLAGHGDGSPVPKQGHGDGSFVPSSRTMDYKKSSLSPAFGDDSAVSFTGAEEHTNGNHFPGSRNGSAVPSIETGESAPYTYTDKAKESNSYSEEKNGDQEQDFSNETEEIFKREDYDSASIKETK